jgi:hypothetical protein
MTTATRILLVLPVAVMTLQAQSCYSDRPSLATTSFPGERWRLARAKKIKTYDYRGERYALFNRKVARRKGTGWEIAYDPAFQLTEAVINRGRYVGDIILRDEDMVVTYEQVPRLKPGAGVVRNPYLEAIEENQGGE